MKRAADDPPLRATALCYGARAAAALRSWITRRPPVQALAVSVRLGGVPRRASGRAFHGYLGPCGPENEVSSMRQTRKPEGNHP